MDHRHVLFSCRVRLYAILLLGWQLQRGKELPSALSDEEDDVLPHRHRRRRFLLCLDFAIRAPRHGVHLATLEEAR